MFQTNNSKENVALNETLDETGLTDIYKTFHPKGAKYTLFSNAHRTVSKIDRCLLYTSDAADDSALV